MKQPCIYILTNKPNGTLYTGVTSNLPKRIYEHKQGLGSQFTKKYSCKILVYYLAHETMETAILEEKRIKAGSRKAKIALIEETNPHWRDLSEDLTL